ncbi:MAG: DNA/RNA nuclease SfsA [Myxococcales bacterium]|nr:DNA/RNA nuclease SfsA [Myxococcales bacterium]
MIYTKPLIEVRILRRYKRFLADVYAPGLLVGADAIAHEACPPGHVAFMVHCANPGGMHGLVVAHNRAWLFDSENPKRKLRYSLELLETPSGALVCVNTNRANALVGEALEQGEIRDLVGFHFKPEVVWGIGEHKSRFDFAFYFEPERQASLCGYLEVKSVTYAPDPVHQTGLVAFPDAVTSRGLKHLEALIQVIAEGKRAILCFCANRSDAERVTIAEAIDPNYASGLRRAIQAGVEVIAVKAQTDINEHRVLKEIPFVFR